jgi:hypothetical protein
MRYLAWGLLALVAFVVLLFAAYLGFETLLPPARPGPHGFRNQDGMGRGLFTVAFALFGARFLADRIVPIGRRKRNPATDKDA